MQGSGVTSSPKRLARKKRRREREEKLWASKSGPVTVKFVKKESDV